MPLAGEEGAVLALALMAIALLSAAGLGLVLTTMTEMSIAANYTESRRALYAAESALERAIGELDTIPEWNIVLGGLATSAFNDGSPGRRVLADGESIDPTTLTNLANCGKPGACSVAEASVITADRPWGVNNPYWRLFAFAPLRDILPDGRADSNLYVVAWVADDPSEIDGNPLADGPPGTPGSGVVLVRAEAFGPGGARESLEAAVVRPARPPQLVRMVWWRRR